LYLPSPHTEPTEINGIHEKGVGGGGMGGLLFQKRIAFILFLIPGAKNDSGCTLRLRPRDFQIKDLLARQSLGRKSIDLLS
jgi:hypothetical protein